MSVMMGLWTNGLTPRRSCRFFESSPVIGQMMGELASRSSRRPCSGASWRRRTSSRSTDRSLTVG
jgi:hypothetical protein